MASLKSTCSVCERRYNNLVADVKNNSAILQEILDLSIQAIPKPKDVKIEKETLIGTRILLKYSCGHSITIDKIQYEQESSNGHYPSLTKGYHTWDYQAEGIKFIIESNFNCLIADEMGLGKTVQALVALREYIDKISPAIIIVPSNIFYQWVSQFREWGLLDDWGILPITSSKSYAIPGFKAYIVSRDLLPDVLDKILSLKPKMIIADEVHGFKDQSSKRTKALVKLCQLGNIQHKVFLGGTPIKNRASEYFTVLNLLAPGYFPSFRHFVTRWLEPNEKGIYTRIRRYALEDFRRLTSRWILRREVKDVMKDLPSLRITSQEITITDPLIRKSYNQTLDLMTNFYNHHEKIGTMELLGWLAKLRRITGAAKVEHAIELAKEFMDSSEDEKLAIGIHHESVRDDLFYGLQPYGAIKISGEDSPEDKFRLVQQFARPENRVAIINEVSGGTGLDGLQVANNVWMLERQWTSADEDQFIKRFHRTGQDKPVHVVYLNAHGTIDTLLDQYVQEKKDISRETYGLDYDLMNDSQGLRELSERVLQSRL